MLVPTLVGREGAGDGAEKLPRPPDDGAGGLIRCGGDGIGLLDIDGVERLLFDGGVYCTDGDACEGNGAVCRGAGADRIGAISRGAGADCTGETSCRRGVAIVCRRLGV